MASPQADSESDKIFGDWRSAGDADVLITEAWGQGFMFGALLIMSMITLANMRRKVLLHKLILLEVSMLCGLRDFANYEQLVLAMSHGTFCFMSFSNYGLYLSSTAVLLYCSYFTHNVISWMKISPFFSGSQVYFGPTFCSCVKWIYLSTLAMSAPVLIFQMYNNFRFFNSTSTLYVRVRPYEPLLRDPWWMFSFMTLVYMIKRCYSLSLLKVAFNFPRFGILLAAFCMALVFTVMDVFASIFPSLSVTYG